MFARRFQQCHLTASDCIQYLMIACKEYINSIYIRPNTRLYYNILTILGPELDQAALALLVSPITVTVAAELPSFGQIRLGYAYHVCNSVAQNMPVAETDPFFTLLQHFRGLQGGRCLCGTKVPEYCLLIHN